jgi:hypothetical protein
MANSARTSQESVQQAWLPKQSKTGEIEFSVLYSRGEYNDRTSWSEIQPKSDAQVTGEGTLRYI